MEKNIQEKKMSTEKTRTSEKDQETWTVQERESLRFRYGCEILKHNCTLEEAKVTDEEASQYAALEKMLRGETVDGWRLAGVKKDGMD